MTKLRELHLLIREQSLANSKDGLSQMQQNLRLWWSIAVRFSVTNVEMEQLAKEECAENRMGVDDKINVSQKCDGMEEWQSLSGGRLWRSYLDEFREKSPLKNLKNLLINRAALSV